jgi:hypothetical protein
MEVPCAPALTDPLDRSLTGLKPGRAKSLPCRRCGEDGPCPCPARIAALGPFKPSQAGKAAMVRAIGARLASAGAPCSGGKPGGFARLVSVLSNQPGRWRLLTAAIFHDSRAAQQRQPPSPGLSLPDSSSTQPGMAWERSRLGRGTPFIRVRFLTPGVASVRLR